MLKNTHGGLRPGAGRKSLLKEPTKVVRVPQSCVPLIKQMIVDVVQMRQHASADVAKPSVVLTKRQRPLFSAAVPAGFPSPADDYIENHLDLNEHFIQHPAATFYVRVKGESMSGAGIFSDDILIVDRSLKPTHGAIVIAVLDNELTVKRLHKRNGKIELRPENPAFPVIEINGDMELIIWGVVSGVTRKL
jgi:DNA polymerase V